MKHTITVLLIQTNEQVTCQAEFLPLNHGGQSVMLARLEGSPLLAELDLQRPEQGWKVFPN